MSGVKKFNNPSWNFYLDKVHTYAYWEKVFTPEECKKIIKIAKDKGLIKGTIGAKSKKESNIRLSKVSWLYASDNLDWAYRKITDVVLNLNERFFQFDIFGLSEGLQFTNYKAPSDRYGKHIDRSFNFLVRKLSLSIQLTDPKEYEGGELLLYESEKSTEMKKEQGTLILFPSYILHEVKPVTKGERNSLVAWVTGKQFK
jgi:PKHD-type hydroxylase